MRKIVGCILAGGKSRRMGGKKKAFLTYRGKRFLDLIRGNLKTFPRIYLSVEDPACYPLEEDWVVGDLFPVTGPMGGITSVLKKCREDAVFVIPCDMIFLSEAVALEMKRVYEDTGMPVLLKGEKGEVSPLPGIYTKEMLPGLEACLEKGDYRLRSLWEKEEYVTVERPEEKELMNINRPEEYRQIQWISVSEAGKLLEESVEEIPETEEEALSQAKGRFLAEDLPAKTDQPPFARSPLDGYAIRAKDSKGASREYPVHLKVTEKIYAGGTAGKAVGEGQAIRLMTGSPIPDGADAVIRQEHTSSVGEDIVEIYESLEPWENYCPRGEDFQKGEVLLKKGRHVDFAAAGVAGAMGYDRIPVRRKVRAGIIVTGDELCEPGEELQPGKIYNSNGYLIRNWMEEMEAEVVSTRCLGDDVEQIARTIEAMSRKTDLIVTCGGVSVGEKDLMPEVFEHLGIRLLFHGVRVKPGAPTMAGMYGDIPVIALSGNPFGVLVHLELLVRPVQKKLTGSSWYEPEYRQGVLETDFSRSCQGLRMIRARWEDGKVCFPDKHASGVFGSMLDCNCLAEVEGKKNGLRKGEKIWVRMLGRCR